MIDKFYILKYCEEEMDYCFCKNIVIVLRFCSVEMFLKK